jgi:hypothetical protein
MPHHRLAGHRGHIVGGRESTIADGGPTAASEAPQTRSELMQEREHRCLFTPLGEVDEYRLHRIGSRRRARLVQVDQ